MYQAKYFQDSELRCKCKKCQKKQSEVNADEKLLMLLDRIREIMNCAVYVTSGVRCAAHNREVGGVANSFHVQGKAADLKVASPRSIVELHKAAIEAGADGIGFYPRGNFVHVDVRGRAARWVE